jgi:hypothetical protein
MKVSNLEFSITEKAILYARAVSVLIEQGESKKTAREIVSTETPQNILRLALGFERRNRGGARPNNGRRNCARCNRIWSNTVKALGEGLCRECWHAQADEKSAAI